LKRVRETKAVLASLWRCYKTFFPPSLMLLANKLEGLPLARFYRLVSYSSKTSSQP
jgi:hypothetical protein